MAPLITITANAFRVKPPRQNSCWTKARLGAALAAFLMITAVGYPAARSESPPSALGALNLRDDPDRHLTLKWQGTIRAESGRPGSWIEGFLEQRYNVTFRPSFIAYFSYPRVLPVRLLTGNVPDVCWVLARDLPRFAKHGFALELPYEVIQQHAPNYVRLLNESAPENWITTYSGGRNYGLPLFSIESHQPRPGFWRKDWLRNVGLTKVPETLDEMREALWRFRHRDPDGNGKQDTYGMCPWKPPVVPEIIDRSFEEIFAAHGIVSTGWVLRDGAVVWGGTTPEARATLATLREWYADGLIYPDYMTAPAGSIDMIKRFTNGQVGYLYGLAEFHAFELSVSHSIASVLRGINPAGEMVPAPFPKGPHGHAGGRGSTIGTVPERLAALMFGAHLAKEPEKLVRVLRMIDEMAVDEELFLTARLGQRGKHWDWRAESGLFVLPPFDKRYHTARQLIHWNPEPWLNWGYYAPFGAGHDLTERLKTPAHREFDARWRAAHYVTEDVLLQATIVPSADKLLGDLVQMQVTVFTEIISGRQPLEDFDRFVRNWYEGGGRQLTVEANELYARLPEILAAAGASKRKEANAQQ